MKVSSVNNLLHFLIILGLKSQSDCRWDPSLNRTFWFSQQLEKIRCLKLTPAFTLDWVLFCSQLSAQYLGYWCGCSWVIVRSWPAGCVAGLSAAVGDAPLPAAPSSSLVARRPPACPSAAPELPPEPPSPPELRLPAQLPPSDLPRPLLANGLCQPQAVAGLPRLFFPRRHREGENGDVQVSN